MTTKNTVKDKDIQEKPTTTKVQESEQKKNELEYKMTVFLESKADLWNELRKVWKKYSDDKLEDQGKRDDLQRKIKILESHLGICSTNNGSNLGEQE